MTFCYACGDSLVKYENWSDIAMTWQYAFLVCGSCGHGQLWPTPDERTLGLLYSEDYEPYEPPRRTLKWRSNRALKQGIATVAARAWFRPAGRSRTANVLVKFAERCAGQSVPYTAALPLAQPKDSPILDFGCGSGWWLQAMKARGYSRLAGFDVGGSPEKTLKGVAEVFGGAPADIPDATFAVIRLEHVLEHLPDPAETLQVLRNKLRPGGRVCLTVPNFASRSSEALKLNWIPLRLPYHLHHFTAVSLRVVAERAEFTISHLRTLPIFAYAPNSEKGGLERLWYAARVSRDQSGDFLSAVLEPTGNSAKNTDDSRRLR